MQTTDHEMRLSGDIIPFQPRTVKSEKGHTKGRDNNDCSLDCCDHSA